MNLKSFLPDTWIMGWVSDREMRSKNFGLPSSPLLFGEEIVVGLGEQCLGCYQVVSFRGPIKPSLGMSCFSLLVAKHCMPKKRNFSCQKKKNKPSVFVNRFPGSLVEPQVANYRLHSKAVPAFTVNQRSPSLMALGTAFVSWTDWGGGRMVSGWFKLITFIVHFTSIITTSAPPQIIRH